ncbi:hypothetical protein DSO57_1016183 [Entomophthora muscae]|uniref:Uncharacterized protein n=1 Tax=Entomophthora muscae TaxID=34485 RepID=A0ACC2TGS4_9FUNG|nr:hypothetical protein DSO57_1016183 [Entomophthora muscae]
MPAEWHWILEEEFLLPLESVFVVSDSPNVGESEKRKRGRVDGTITAFAVIVRLSSDAALSGWEGR